MRKIYSTTRTGLKPMAGMGMDRNLVTGKGSLAKNGTGFVKYSDR